MAERVVVGLETVKIEDPECHCVMVVDRSLEVSEELAAVPESGESVGGGVMLAAPSRSGRVVIRDRERNQEEDDRDASPEQRHRRRAGCLCAVRGVRPVEAGCQVCPETARTLALAELARGLARVFAVDQHRDAVDEHEICSDQSLNFGRSVRAAEARELLERAIEHAFRVRQLRGCPCPARCKASRRTGRRPERRRKNLSLLISHLREQGLSAARLVCPALELDHNSNRQGPKQPRRCNDGHGSAPVRHGSSRTRRRGLKAHVRPFRQRAVIVDQDCRGRRPVSGHAAESGSSRARYLQARSCFESQSFTTPDPMFGVSSARRDPSIE